MWTTQPFVILNMLHERQQIQHFATLHMQECGGFVYRNLLASTAHVRYERWKIWKPLLYHSAAMDFVNSRKLLLHFLLSSDRLHQTNSSLIQAVLYCLYLQLFLYINHFPFYSSCCFPYVLISISLCFSLISIFHWERLGPAKRISVFLWYTVGAKSLGGVLVEAQRNVMPQFRGSKSSAWRGIFTCHFSFKCWCIICSSLYILSCHQWREHSLTERKRAFYCERYIVCIRWSSQPVSYVSCKILYLFYFHS
jgi:hypothetical protein